MGQSFLEKLKEMVLPLYQNIGGHGPDHHQRMEGMYKEISGLIPDVDEDEYIVAVCLHSLDRGKSFKEMTAVLTATLNGFLADNGFSEDLKKSIIKKMTREVLAVVLNGLLADSGFSESSKKSIVGAILEHSKFKDGKDDSPLLQAIRLADKWDRIGTIGVFSGLMFLGEMPLYTAEKPFGYGSTAEGEQETNYWNFYRVLEWVSIFPLLRKLIQRHPKRLWNFLGPIRDFAEEVSEAHDVPNKVEVDIERCLGEFYEEWRPELRPR